MKSRISFIWRYLQRPLYGIAMLLAMFTIVTAEQWFLMPPSARAQTNTFCASNLSCTVAGTWGFSSVSSVSSSTANPAASGTIRLANIDSLCWRNNANGADVCVGNDGPVSGNIPADALNYSPGIISPFFSPNHVQTAATGQFRLSSNDTINWRNNANGADISFGKNAADQFTVPTAIAATGTPAVITGTGACATVTTQTGGAWAGSAKCTGVTGASTLIITPGTTATNGWACDVQDETTRANLFQQTSHSAAACTLTITSVTQNDVFVFQATPF